MTALLSLLDTRMAIGAKALPIASVHPAMRRAADGNDMVNKGCGLAASGHCAMRMPQKVGPAFTTPFRVIAAFTCRRATCVMASVSGARRCNLAFATDAVGNVLEACRAEAGRLAHLPALMMLPLSASRALRSNSGSVCLAGRSSTLSGPSLLPWMTFSFAVCPT